MSTLPPDNIPTHGGGVDAAVRRFGGTRGGWLDLSTGINQHPYPLEGGASEDWYNLPDEAAVDTTILAARQFWSAPDSAAVLAVPGLSAVIARLPDILPGKAFFIRRPTYSEYETTFLRAGWQMREPSDASVHIYVNPNNPTGELATPERASYMIIDESFCDTCPEHSLIKMAANPNVLILKSFGKFWGLAGLRLGFAIGGADLIAELAKALGPWPVSGPALALGTRALSDSLWAKKTRIRLANKSAELDKLLAPLMAEPSTGTTLFRLYKLPNAYALYEHLASRHILTRIFANQPSLIRVAIPQNAQSWAHLKKAVAEWV